MDNENEINYKALRYVLYVRKSTTDETRQVRSIGDQIADCMTFADRNRIRVIGKPLIETKSAKQPNNRPIFNQMLKDIQTGKYDGILAWNPDRLARNMLEAGKIIDMIDNNIIKDLKFYNHTFTKDANGKMLLGMAFVLSKQYSDDLSQKVTRGVRKSFEEGRSWISKHGYVLDENKQYQPDGKNFDLILQAWRMRKEGHSLEAIANKISAQGYVKVMKTGKKVQITKQMLTDLFRDPFYYGLLLQTNQKVDLRLFYNFKPMITEKEYAEVQSLSGKYRKPFAVKNGTYYPLRMLVICYFCGNHMYAGASRGSTGKKYLFYRCEAKYCLRKKKSIRAKAIFGFIYKFLEEGLSFSDKQYKQYLESMTKYSKKNKDSSLLEIHSNETRLRYLRGEIKDISYKVLDFHKDSIVRSNNEARLQQYEDEKSKLEEKNAVLRNQITEPEQDIVSYEQFFLTSII